jgi:hypothetical protein
MPGWKIRMSSGHAETIAATFAFRRAGDTTSGPICLEAESSPATPPILTFSNNGDALQILGSNIWIGESIELRNSNATKTASVAINYGASSGYGVIRKVKIAHSTDKFWRAIATTTGGGQLEIEDCEIAYCAATGTTNGAISLVILDQTAVRNCNLHDNAGWAIISSASNNDRRREFTGNIFDTNGGGYLDKTVASQSSSGGAYIAFNTFYGNTSDALEFDATPANNRGVTLLAIHNNIFANNGGYGINFAGASVSLEMLRASGVSIRGNNFYSNSSGKYLPSDVGSLAETTLDPQFTDAAGGDFRIGANLKATGYPLGATLAIGGYGSNYSYIDPGALQRQEAGGGGGVSPSLSGGIFQ